MSDLLDTYRREIGRIYIGGIEGIGRLGCIGEGGSIEDVTHKVLDAADTYCQGIFYGRDTVGLKIKRKGKREGR